MSDSAKSTVPRFSSFKPKQISTKSEAEKAEKPEQSQPPERPAAFERRSSNQVPHRHHNKGDPRESHRRRHRLPEHTSRRRDDDPANHNKDQRSTDAKQLATTNIESEFEESDVFIVDLRGDRKNIEYGYLHRYSIPTHHRAGYGGVIGLPAKVKIDREASDDKIVRLRYTDHNQKQRAPRLLTSKLSGLYNERLQKIVASEDAVSNESDFIPLRPALKRKRLSDILESERGVDYRSIENKAKAEDHPEDDDLSFASSSDSDGPLTARQLQIRQENAILTKRTKEDSQDSKSWIALLNHQSKVINPRSLSLAAGEKRALADIKLSIYNKALKHIPKGNAGYDELVVGMLDTGTVIWEKAKLAKTWNEVLSNNPDSLAIWTKYLDFVQTDGTEFGYESCKETYLRCLKMLHEAGTKTSETNTQAIVETYLYVLLRFTAFIRDAGYDELAIAIWQMVLEYQFFRPPDSSATELERSFQQFWDCELPRIGEEGAQGWFCSLTQSDVPEREGSQSLTDTALPDPVHPFRSFATLEFSQLNHVHLPAAPNDDNPTADPFCDVMFSDLAPILSTLLPFTPSIPLVNGFLTFMHMPLLARSENDTYDYHKWQKDQFLQSPCISTPPPRSPTVNQGALPNLQLTTYALFTTAFTSNMHNNTNLPPGTIRFLDRVIHILATAGSSSYANDSIAIAEYYLAFKLHFLPSEAPKTAKHLLKTRTSSLRLYNAYALIETARGRLEKGSEVWNAAIAMSAHLGGEEYADRILLRHNSTLSALENGRETDALSWLLGHKTEGVQKSDGFAFENSAADRLRANHSFQHGWAMSLDQQKYVYAVYYAECMALMHYLLSSSHDLENVLPLFQAWSSSLQSCKESSSSARSMSSLHSANELLHQAKARLITHHILNKRSYRPSTIRSELLSSLDLFSTNSMLVQLFTDNEARFHLHDRVRASIQSPLHDETKADVVTWSNIIMEELRRFQAGSAGATASSVRATFTKALLSSDSAQRQNEHDEAWTRTKAVFFDGIRCLPWYKPWIITGLKVFVERGSISSSELSSVFNVLGERELRVRFDHGL
ncbi:Hypothetical protein R9X50_00644700 [Acrodontium crateriforme]|uniref:DUF1740-domain-containing protein n=1 Tax=Acrodontium crateriforme TaxID=150365 RepID=A0AAQ3MBJ8_9PEZI|nr:Hypothetical protein R9X50_00644700 [Acrodontium crateriforme]